MVYGVFAAHAVMRAGTERQEVALELDVLLPFRAEAIGVKCRGVRETLQITHSSRSVGDI